MRILHILDHSIPLHSGYTFRTRAILHHQRQLGWETFHLTSPKHRGNGDLIETVDGLEFFRTPPLPLWVNRLPLINHGWVVKSLVKRLDEIIPRLRPDLIHAHSPALNGLAALIAGRRHRLPVVYECRAFWEDAAVDHGTSREAGLRYRLTRTLETFVFQRADAVTTICEGLKQDIVARGISAAKVTVIPNAVDVTRFTFNAMPDAGLRAALGMEGAVVLGFIGSFYAYEGLDLLVAAMSAIVAAKPEVRLLLVGGGPMEETLRSQAQRLGIADKIVFTGRVPHDRVQDYYNQVDLFIYPRLPMRLTELVTPLKPLEAMAQGKPVLASDVGGHRELILPGETGWLFPAGNAQALAQAVIDMLDQRDRWPERIAKARQFVERERNWRDSVGRYVTVYGNLGS